MASIFDRLRAKAQQAITGVGNFLDQDKSMAGVQAVQGGLGNKFQQFFAPVPDQVRPRDVIREAPGALFDTATKYLTQAPARGIQTLTNTAERAIGAGPGVTTPQQIQQMVPNETLRKILYGDDAITSLQDITERRAPQTADALKWGGVNPQIADMSAAPLTFLGAGALTVADALPGDPSDLLKGGGKATADDFGRVLMDGVEDINPKTIEELLQTAERLNPTETINDVVRNTEDLVETLSRGKRDFLATEKGIVPLNKTPKTTGAIDNINALLEDINPERVAEQGLQLPAPESPILLEDVLSRSEMPNVANDLFSTPVPPSSGENAVNAAKETIKTTKSKGRKLVNDLVQPSLDVIRKSGESGKKAAQLVEQSEEQGARLAGDWLDSMRKAITPLNDAEKSSLADVIEGVTAPTSQAQANAVNTWKYIARDLRERGVKAGLDIGQIDNYFPHLPDESQMTKEAQEAVKQAMGRSGQRRFGNLELPRELDAPYLKDPGVLFNYIDKAARRVTDAQHFGPNDSKLYDLAKQAGTEGGDTVQLNKYFDQILGKNQDPNAEALSQKFRSVQSFKLNPVTSVKNLTQNISTLARTDVDSVGRALNKVLTNTEEAKSIFIRSGESGVDFDNALKELSGATGKYIKGIGMGVSEKANRIVAVNSGYEYASKLAKQFEGGSEAAMRELKNLGFSAEEIAEGLKEADFITAGRRISQETQFSSAPGKLPYAANTPAGKVITQFKPFAYKQTIFLKNIVGRTLTEAKHGNFKPLVAMVVAYGLAAPVAGELINETKSKVTNKKRTDTGSAKDRYLSDMASGFSLGLVDSLPALSGEYGMKGIGSTLGGPTVGLGLDALETAASIPEYLKGDEYAGRTAARNVLKQIPVVGQTLSNTLVPNSYVENYLGPNEGLNEKDTETYKLLQNSDPGKAELFKQENQPATNPQETKKGSVLDSIQGLFGEKKAASLTIPKENATFDEKKKFREDAQAVINEGGSLKKDEWQAYILDGKSPTSESIEERTKAYSSIKSALDSEYYTDEQKQQIVDSSGVDPDNYQYFELASKDEDARLQELLPKLDNMDTDQAMEFLMMGRRAVAGKQLVSSGMIDYLYENDTIDEDQKEALKALRYDEIKDKFYVTKAFQKKASGGSGKAKDTLTFKEALSLFKVDLPKVERLGGVSNLLKTYSTNSGDNSTASFEKILQQQSPNTQHRGDLWF